MSALNKKSFLTYLKEGGIYVVLLVLLANYYFPGSYIFKSVELK